jgi:hypothetical protein
MRRRVERGLDNDMVLVAVAYVDTMFEDRPPRWMGSLSIRQGEDHVIDLIAEELDEVIAEMTALRKWLWKERANYLAKAVPVSRSEVEVGGDE